MLSLLVPAGDRRLVLGELDALSRRRAHRPGRGGSRLWYLGQLVSFAVRLRLEGLRRLPRTLGGLFNDLAFSVRTLLRRPGYLVAGVLTLAVGTGGVAIVYGAADWVLLRDVPGVVSPDELSWVRLESTESWAPNSTWGIMHPDLERMRQQMPSLRSLEASTEVDVHFQVPGGPPPARVTASMVTPGYFRMLELRPPVGRLIDPGDHAEHEGPPEVVVGHDLWHRYWGGAPDVVGHEVEVNGRPYTVVGVAPEGFRGAEIPGRSSLWFTTSAFADLMPAEAEAGLERTIQLWDRLVGRRVPGAPVERVQAEANAAMEAIRDERAGQHHSFLPTHFVFRAYPGVGLDPGIRSQVRSTLTILGAASLVLLLLATANVANLGLTRASSRRGLSAIRRALGAGSWRVAREPLLEGLVIGLLGGALGVAVVFAGEAVFGEASLSSRGASLEGMRVGPVVVLVSMAVAVLAGVVSGLIPAWSVRRDRALDWLAGGRADGRTTTRVRSLLVIGQVALSGALLVTAALFGRTMVNLNTVDLGYPRDVFSFSIDPGLDSPDPASVTPTLDGVLTGLEQRFGPGSAGLVFPRPLQGWRITGVLNEPGAPREERTPGSTFWISGTGFFSALGVPFLAGEGFRQDAVGVVPPERPVVINEAMARDAFPERPIASLIGRTVVLNQDEDVSRIVGVVADARIVAPDHPTGPLIFRPYVTDFSEGAASFYVRSGMPEHEMARITSAVVQEADGSLPMYDVSTVGAQVDGLLVQERVVARLAGAVSLIGALLVALGLYGVLTYTVQARTREIGVRAALGASAARIRRGVLRKGMLLVMMGLMTALPLAWWVTRYVESRLYGMDPLDPFAFGFGIALMLLVAFTASWIPARRATRISPAEALREE